MNSNFDELASKVEYLANAKCISIEDVLYQYSVKQIESEYNRISHEEYLYNKEKGRKNIIQEIATKTDNSAFEIAKRV